jgi:hypothetical protein
MVGLSFKLPVKALRKCAPLGAHREKPFRRRTKLSQFCCLFGAPNKYVKAGDFREV